MEALVNAAYDRISEDIILLYDAFQAYEEAHPRPPLSALLEAIRQVLKEEDKGRKAWSVWNSISREDLRSMGGARLEAATGALSESKTIYNKTKNNDDVAPSESGLREMIRVLLTSIMSDLAVLPFWTVKLSSVAQRGRNDALWPFKGYMVSFQSIIEDEGWSGLFKGAVPVCIGGLLRYLRRNRRLYSDYYSKTTQRLTAKLVMKEPGGLKAHDPEILVQTYEGVGVKALWAALLHPFDLIATRMITTSGEKYRNVTNSLKTIIKERGWSGLLLGVRSSLIRSILPHRSIYTMGVPFLVKTRRMLDGMDDVYRTGMGGSLEILRDILRVQGIQGLFSGLRATCWGFFPAFGALCGARLLVYLLTGNSSHASVQRRKRKALLRNLLSSVSGSKPPSHNVLPRSVSPHIASRHKISPPSLPAPHYYKSSNLSHQYVMGGWDQL